MDFSVTKRGSFELPPEQKKKLDALMDGDYKVSIRKRYGKASHKQFKYLYKIVYPMLLEGFLDAGYSFANIDELDAYCKTVFAGKETVNIMTGEIITLPASKAEFVTVDEMVYCDKLRDMAREFLNIEIPNPNE